MLPSYKLKCWGDGCSLFYGMVKSKNTTYIIKGLAAKCLYSTVWYGTVRYHIEGSMKLNACILHLIHMVYLYPKHNLLLAWYIHCGTWSHPLFTNPLFFSPFIQLLSWPPGLLTWRSLLCAVARILVHSCLRLAVNWTLPTLPTFPFPLNGSPCSTACPLKTTLRYRLRIVRYRYNSITLPMFTLHTCIRQLLVIYIL